MKKIPSLRALWLSALLIVCAMHLARAQSLTPKYFGVANFYYNTRSVVFRVNPDLTGLEVIHQFTEAQGDDPEWHLYLGNDSKLYGVTTTGGVYGYGTLFRLNTDGGEFEVLHHFNGFRPEQGLLISSDNWIYWIGDEGLVYGNSTIFRIRTDGTGLAALHNFVGDGYSFSPLVEAPNGTIVGGKNASYGFIFKINGDGTGYQIIHQFSGPDGSRANFLTISPEGTVFGTTVIGGLYNKGTVFRMRLDGS